LSITGFSSCGAKVRAVRGSSTTTIDALRAKPPTAPATCPLCAAGSGRDSAAAGAGAAAGESDGLEHAAIDSVDSSTGRAAARARKRGTLELYNRGAQHPAPMSQWTVRPDEAGVRLDKYLAAPTRAGSRARATAALDRGKIFLNDREMSPRDAAVRVA